MRHEQMSLLTESIYDAAVDPEGWSRVMQLLKQQLSTQLEGLYYLDSGSRSMRTVHAGGLTEPFRRSFDQCFFQRDNPWTRSKPLHKPGVVRTDERLAAYFGDPQILRKSQYYNDWMRPQHVNHTIGTTLLSEGGSIFNLTLLRPADVGSFTTDEVKSFARVCGHFRRAMRIAMRLDAFAAQRSMTYDALDCLRYGVAFLNLDGKLLYCNAVTEALIEIGNGLTVRHGRLAAVDGAAQRKLAALLQYFANDPSGAKELSPEHTVINRGDDARPLVLSAIRLSTHRRAFVTAQPTILLMIVDPDAAMPTAIELIRQLYQLTQAEARLAHALLTGGNLRQAADKAGMTYETARWYLKLLFQKTDTKRQAELVARLLSAVAVPLKAPS
ncbi:MAG: helix-turn-helix transcriptional regulator [Proteobacteria bacterium]|nr:helix-turn-helix transcriptional regulator [Pseudomonadota bacterium]